MFEVETQVGVVKRSQILCTRTIRKMPYGYLRNGRDPTHKKVQEYKSINSF